MKNNKGFFLVEAVVVITLITITMAFVYPNLAKIFDNYNNSVKYYDQIEDIYVLKSMSLNLSDTIKRSTCDDPSDASTCDIKEVPTINTSDNTFGCRNFSTSKLDITPANKYGDLEKLYITNYLAEPSDSNYDFNKYLKRMKKTINDTSAYRIIGLFNNGSEYRYASIKIDNPNPNRNCH